MTAAQTKPNLNTLIMSICSFIILCSIGWVGHTAAVTHDSSIAMEVRVTNMEANIGEIKTKMLTRTDLSVELLKLQIPDGSKISKP